MSPSDRLFPSDPTQRAIARELYGHAKDLPILSPHGHVDPAILAEDRPFPDPARLIVVPDHYVTRMLLSQGIRPAELGVPTIDGSPFETDGRMIWQRLAKIGISSEEHRPERGRRGCSMKFSASICLSIPRPPTRSTTRFPTLAQPEFRPARCSSDSTWKYRHDRNPHRRPAPPQGTGRGRLGWAGRTGDHDLPTGQHGGLRLARLERKGRASSVR